MSPKTRITVIGSLNKDLNARTPRLPSPGETLLASSFTTSSGGKGGNQAVACSRLLSTTSSSRRRRHHQQQQHEQPNNNNNDDIDDDSTNRSSTITVRMIGSVGSDQFGNESIAGLEENGVDISGVRIRKDEKTGVAIVIVDDRTGENRILVSPNANFIWSVDEVWRDLGDFFTPPVIMEEDYEKKMKKMKEEGKKEGKKEDEEEDFELIILQLEIPLEIVCQIIQSAKQRKKNVHVLLNAAPARKLPREIYPGVTHLILNESEAKLLSSDSDSDSDSPTPTPSNENENETTPKEEKEEEKEEEQTASKFLKWGVQNVIITLGARGAYYASSSSSSSSSSIIQKGHQPIPTPVPVQNVIDTTGAGDTFVGAYAVRLCEDRRAGREMDVRARVEWANRVAAKSVQREGARGGMPWRDEVL